MIAPLGFQIPDGLRFEGWMEMLGIKLAQFTELDTAAASYGATFSLREKHLNPAALAEMRETKRREFGGAAQHQS